MTAILTALVFTYYFVMVVLGESFKIDQVNAAAITFLLLLLQAVLIVAALPMRRTWPRHLFLLPLWLAYFILGALRYPIRDVIEDAAPLATFIVLVNCLDQLSSGSRENLVRFVVWLSALSLIKILFINSFDVHVSWGGDSLWQATKTEVVPGLNRITLKGADVFLIISTALLIGSLLLRDTNAFLFGRSKSALLLVALVASLLFSFSRASFAAIVIGVIVWVALSARARVLRAKSVAAFAIVVTASAIAIGPLSLSQAVNVRLAQDEQNISSVYRLVESARALEHARQFYFLGSGFGLSFYTPFSGTDRPDERGLFVHVLPIWLILKVGVVGLIVFASTIVRSIRASYSAVAQSAERSAAAPALLSALGLIVLSINDLSNNKFATVSGAAAYALALCFWRDVSGRRNAPRTP
jgi:hypothetical protein